MQNRSDVATEYLDCVVDWEFNDKIAERRTVNVPEDVNVLAKQSGETRGMNSKAKVPEMSGRVPKSGYSCYFDV